MARALWLPAALRQAGLTVVEDAGWTTRGRSDFVPRGVIVHATAGGQGQSNDSAWNLLVNGRPGLSGPISQVMLERGTLRWRMVASGASNHAKTGWAGNCYGLGNRDLIGIEAHHDNLSEPWTEQALDVYARGVAAICRALGINTSRVALHKEHQPGEKSDPTFNGDIFRARVAALLSNPNTPQGVDDMGWEHVTAMQGGATPWGEQALAEPVPTWARGFGQYNIKRVVDMLTVSAQREQDMLTTIKALAGSGGGSFDVAAVLARIDERSADVTGRIAELEAELAAAHEAAAARLRD